MGFYKPLILLILLSVYGKSQIYFPKFKTDSINYKLLCLTPIVDVKKSSMFKFTYKAKLDRDAVDQIITNHSLPADITISSMTSFNVRLRWKINDQHRIYMGSENMTRKGNNALYFGYSYTIKKKYNRRKLTFSYN